MRSEPQGFFEVGGRESGGGWLYDDNNVDDNNCNDHDDYDVDYDNDDDNNDDDYDVYYDDDNDGDDDDNDCGDDGDDDGDDDNEPPQLTRNEREVMYFWEQFGQWGKQVKNSMWYKFTGPVIQFIDKILDQLRWWIDNFVHQQLSHAKKQPLTFHYSACSKGILRIFRMVYITPYIIP